MDLITIFQTILRWGIPALAGGMIVFLFLASAYLFYKKALHGKRRLTKIQAVSAFLLCGWLLLVLGLTSLSRGANYRGEINLDFFRSYVNAWNQWSIGELQLILFNMLMFAPFGFLLPLLWKKAEKIWVTWTASLGLTALIEGIQLLSGTGIFELDDLFLNSVGSLFGYFCIMAILVSIREKRLRFAPIGKALLIPGAVCLALGAAFWAYARQPYGNMDILPAAKQDMSGVEIITTCDFSDQGATASVYKNEYAEDKAYMQRIRAGLAALENLTFSDITRREGEDYVYTGRDSMGNEFQLNFFFRRGQWSYTIFAENAAELTEETAQRYRDRYESWMKEWGLLPDQAVFSLQNRDTLRWDVAPAYDISTGDGAFQSGSVMIQFDENGTVTDFFYQISWNAYVATEEILSSQEAYGQVACGNFEQYVPFQKGDRLCVEACELAYVYDTKGFYQPVYQFSGYRNSAENLWVCQIPARRG